MAVCAWLSHPYYANLPEKLNLTATLLTKQFVNEPFIIFAQFFAHDHRAKVNMETKLVNVLGINFYFKKV